SRRRDTVERVIRHRQHDRDPALREVTHDNGEEHAIAEHRAEPRRQSHSGVSRFQRHLQNGGDGPWFKVTDPFHERVQEEQDCPGWDVFAEGNEVALVVAAKDPAVRREEIGAVESVWTTIRIVSYSGASEEER